MPVFKEQDGATMTSEEQAHQMLNVLFLPSIFPISFHSLVRVLFKVIACKTSLFILPRQLYVICWWNVGNLLPTVLLGSFSSMLPTYLSF